MRTVGTLNDGMHAGQIAAGTYDPVLVLVSVLVATLASYAAFDLAGHVRSTRGLRRFVWLSGAGTAAGGGIWAMHFIGMLAFDMGMPVQYRLQPTLASLLLPILVTGAGLAVSLRNVASRLHLLAGGGLMGAGIVGMHYLGMSGMRMEAMVSYDPWLVAASVLIALGASTAALSLIRRRRSFRFKLAGAVVMGAAISGMHYTGMAAARFTAGSHLPDPPLPPLNPTTLAGAVAAVTLLILLLALAATQIRRQRMELDAAEAIRRRLSGIAANLPGVVYRRVLHTDGSISYPYISEGFGELVGEAGWSTQVPASFEEMAARYVHQEDRERWRLALVASGETLTPFQVEARIRHRDGSIRWVRSAATPHRGDNGEIVWDGVMLDLSDLKQTEARLEASLAEKEALVRETHHRVKNNLQTVASLLGLEGSRLTDAHARERMEVVRQRIGVLSRLHTHLYQSAEAGQVDLRTHLEELCRNLTAIYCDVLPVTVAVSAEPLLCDVGTAMPLGLLANELVTNSMKHAFPDGRPGRVEIVCRRVPDTDLVELVVEDDGIGMPAGPAAGKGLGTVLMKALAAQLGGRIEVTADAGTRTRVLLGADRFTAPEPAAALASAAD